MITFILGAARSCKSGFAQDFAARLAGLVIVPAAVAVLVHLRMP